MVNPDPADWTPQIQDGEVNTILQMGTKVVVGGTFTQVRRAGFSQLFTRNFMFAFDMDTGVIDPNFVPVLNAEVEQLAPVRTGPRSSSGGDFSTVNGQSYKKIVRLNLADGSSSPASKRTPTACVQDLVLQQRQALCLGQVRRRSKSIAARPGTASTQTRATSTRTSTCRSPTRFKGSLGVPEIDVSPGRLQARRQSGASARWRAFTGCRSRCST